MKRKIKTLSKLSEIKELEQRDIEYQIEQITNELDSEKKKLNVLEEMISDALKAFNERQKDCSNINDLGLFYEYFYRISKNIEVKKSLISKKIDELDSKRNILLKTYQEKKIYENLRDNFLKKERKKELLSEQKEIDFLFIARKHKNV